jgi:hypothetical protein
MPAKRSLAVRRPRHLVPTYIALAFGVMSLLSTGLIGITSIAVAQPSSAAYSIWSESVAPVVAADPDTTSVEVGTRFVSKQPGSVTAIRFYKSSANRGPHTGSIWSPGGTKLASILFESTKPSGWQTAELDRAVRIDAGKVYTVSYRALHGRYADDEMALGDGRTVTTADLTALAGVYTYGEGMPRRVWNQSNYYVDVVFQPATTTTAPEPTVKPTSNPTSQPPTPTIKPSPPPTSTIPTSSTTPTGSTTAGQWPDANNTGVPSGVSLSAYTGPCTITAANTAIDAKTVNCDLMIKANNVKISRSKINGSVSIAENAPSTYSFTLTDSTVNGGDRVVTSLGAQNFTAKRVHVTGGNRSMHCWMNCLVEDSYMHGQMTDETGVAHESGIRMGQGGTIRHNTITCDAPDVPPDAGCSAGLTGYGDFAPVENNTIDSNLFQGTTGGYCAYGGSSTGKPYPDTSNIVFTNNVFERGKSGRCGWWGPITSFDANRPGNVWSGNTWADGNPVAAAN